MEAVWVAIVVGIGAVFTTVLTAILTGRQIRAGKAQDYERQDQVAAKAAEAASLLEARQNAIQEKAEEAARLLIASNKQVAKQTAESIGVTFGKLNQIHELVNSNLTAQMEEVHAALSQQLVLMNEVVSLNMAAGREPSKDAIEAIKIIESRLTSLASRLYGRAKATEVADAKVKDAT